MFGIIEFYCKHNLGYEPLKHDFFDEEYHSKFRKIYITDAINKVKKTNTEIGRSITDIDKFTSNKLKGMGIEDYRWTRAKIADRLSFVRNLMVHGENHSFYDKGEYLSVMYILFHLHEIKKKFV